MNLTKFLTVKSSIYNSISINQRRNFEEIQLEYQIVLEKKKK